RHLEHRLFRQLVRFETAPRRGMYGLRAAVQLSARLRRETPAQLPEPCTAGDDTALLDHGRSRDEVGGHLRRLEAYQCRGDAACLMQPLRQPIEIGAR